jgi:mannose-6-phosphate isomerase-like protein (cupin superfamily)
MTDAAIDPIALQKGEGEAFWFLGQLLTIKASAEASGGGLTLIEAVAGRGPGAPLHVHHNDNEWFFVLEGEMAFWVGGTTIEAPAGSFVYGPREIPHTFDVTSSQARFLLGTNPAGFESFVRMVGEPAKELTLPPPPEGPPDMRALAAAAEQAGIEILGPPGFPP